MGSSLLAMLKCVLIGFGLTIIALFAFLFCCFDFVLLPSMLSLSGPKAAPYVS